MPSQRSCSYAVCLVPHRLQQPVFRYGSRTTEVWCHRGGVAGPSFYPSIGAGFDSDWIKFWRRMHLALLHAVNGEDVAPFPLDI